MRIKHFSGYGVVNAVRETKTKGWWNLMIIVSGDHERGLLLKDKDDIYRWLVTKFDKFIDDSRWIDDVDVYYDFNKMVQTGHDVVVYKISYRREDYWSGKYRELEDLKGEKKC